MFCTGCGKESATEFNFCPNCGKPAETELPSPSLEVQPVTDAPTDESAPIKDGETGTAIRVGTLVFGAFSAISLLVAMSKGFVPIYLLEAAGWAGVAWYWQKKKTHSELAKAIVIVLAVLIAIGEVVHIASQPESQSKQIPAGEDDIYKGLPDRPTDLPPAAGDDIYKGLPDRPTDLPPAAGDDIYKGLTSRTETPAAAEIEQQAVALYKQKRYSDARSLFDQACNGGEMRACNYLGYLYAHGLGGPHDLKAARQVYQRACDQGTLSSCASLGSLYQDVGDGDSARKYFQKACNGGVAEACDLLRGVQ
jgi:tetratricopeptide (TPR) repeat protein